MLLFVNHSTFQQSSMELFGISSSLKAHAEEKSSHSLRIAQELVGSLESEKVEEELDDSKYENATTFQELGLCDWLCHVTRSVSYREPTAIQKKCIPKLLSHHDVLAGAETGSGKTASYILPLLQVLTEDPYGIFAVILAPTRELAIQISDQILILGSAANVTVSLVVGGLNFVEQSQQLARRPHFVVATPGRFRQQLETADPPNLMKIQYVIFDEADKLISTGFAEDLEIILQSMNPQRVTGFFSATITKSLKEISSFALKQHYCYIDLTLQKRIPDQLLQQYILVPSKIKICYLITLLFKIFDRSLSTNETMNDIENIEDNPLLTEITGKSNRSTGRPKPQRKNKKHFKEKDSLTALLSGGKEANQSNERVKRTTLIIFVDTCQKCYELAEILMKFSFPVVALHSLLSQSQRLLSLQLFKTAQATILIATDVASRGLDIPEVNYVINYNLPKICSDYIHRVGRTSRAGRSGTAISFITQYDIHLLKKIESYCETKIVPYTEIVPRQVKGFLVPVAQIVRTVRLDFENSRFVEIQERKKKRKQLQRLQLRTYSASTSRSSESHGANER